MVDKNARTAVVLFNLGGPDKPESVQPFLYNLFRDPAILRVPQPIRSLLAAFISWRRASIARGIYSKIGGSSPILRETQRQAVSLNQKLTGEVRGKVFIAMRYWEPLIEDTVREVLSYAPDNIVLLPLYPQFSTTTTASSIAEWSRAARALGVTAPTYGVCCYPTNGFWLLAQAKLIKQAFEEALKVGKPRILFSAHGLPSKVVENGDPYQWQVEQTAAALVSILENDLATKIDVIVCYQSRVGPLKWIEPSTVDQIRRAGADGVPIVIAPIAFVSEHSETLVELDIEGRDFASSVGVPFYVRVPTVSANPIFIDALVNLIGHLIQGNPDRLCSGETGQICPKHFSGCAMGKFIGSNRREQI